MSLIPDGSNDPSDPSPGESDPGTDPNGGGGLVALGLALVLLAALA